MNEDHRFINTDEGELVCTKCGMVVEDIEQKEIDKLFYDNEEFMTLHYYGNIDIMTQKLAMSNIIKGYGRYYKLGKLHQKLSYREKDVLLYRMNKILQDKFKIPYWILIDANKEYQKYLKENGKTINKVKFCRIILRHIKKLKLPKERVQEIKDNLEFNLHLKKLR